MAENTIKIRVKKSDDITHVKMLINHPMSAGLKDGDDAHFIQEVNCEHNGTLIFKANWGTYISNTPYLSFKFEGGNPGDDITVSWIDNLGDTDSHTAVVG